jgi:hypothetical protein
MKSDKICSDPRTRNHIGIHSVESDRILSSNRQSDPATEKLGVSVLCLILIKLKIEALGIWPANPLVTPTTGSYRIQHYGSGCDSESRKPTGIQPKPIEFCRVVGSYKIRSNPISDWWTWLAASRIGRFIYRKEYNRKANKVGKKT